MGADAVPITERKKCPEVGTKMYLLHEHLYHIPDRAAPVKEYCVCEAEVQGNFTGGYTEIRLIGPSPEGFRTPYFYRLNEVGKKLFYTAKEAALLALQMTEKYEQTGVWINNPPMRRPWMHYLKNKE